MAERYNSLAGCKREYTHCYTYILMVYFLLAPFEDLLSSEIGTLGKWLAILAVAVGIYECKGRVKLQFKEGNICLLILMLLGAASCLWAILPEAALERNVAYLTLPGFYLFVSVLDFSEKEYERIVRAIILGGVLTAVYMLVNGYIGRSGRVQLDESNDPNNLAALLQLPLAMAFGMAARKRARFRLLYSFGVLLIGFALLMTGSRGGMISAVIFFLSFLFFSKAYKKAGMLIGLVAVLVIVWQFVLPALPEEISARLFETDYNAEMDNGSRTRIWRVVFLGLFPKMPAYGVGAGCAGYALEAWFGRIKGVHNTYLCMVCEYGVLGIGFFISFLIAKLKKQLILHHYTEAALLLGMYATIFFLDAYAKKFFWNAMILAAIADHAGGATNPSDCREKLFGNYRKEILR